MLESCSLWFSKSFRKFFIHFFSINIEVRSVNKLEETIYYQESCKIEDYLDEFQTLISDANYTDSHTIVFKFRRGFWTTI